MSRRLKLRNAKGVSGMVMVALTAFVIIMLLGFLAFEYLRYSLVQQELRSVCDSAALAGAVGIATGGVGNTIWQQDEEAMGAAYNAFCQNTLSDQALNSVNNLNPTVNPSEGAANLQPGHFNNNNPWTNVQAGVVQVNFVLLDGNGQVTNWNPGAGPDQAGLIPATNLRVDAYYGYKPPILGGLGIGPFTMFASSQGGLPQLDVILCFDTSGSMDDFTNATFINRYWVDTRIGTLSPTDVNNLGLPSTFSGGCIEYDIPKSAGKWSTNPPYWTATQDGSASGPLYYVMGCDQSTTSNNGTAVNVQPPENLSQAISPTSGCQYVFKSSYRNSGVGNPPGNYNGGSPAAIATTSGGMPCYTDLVVNLNGDSHWAPGSQVTVNGQKFKDIAWALEAARGNLENATALQTAVNPEAGNVGDNNYSYIINNLGTGQKTYVKKGFYSISSAGGGSGQAGSQIAYWGYVQSNTHPISDAISAASNFFSFLYGTTDCHFGLICFSDGIGNAPNDTWADGFEAPVSSGTHINGWTTQAVGSSSASPPLSANIAGHYTGGPSMGLPDANYPPPASDSVDSQGGNGTFLLPLLELNSGQSFSPSGSNYDNYTQADPAGATVQNYMKTGNGMPGSGNGIVATGSTDITDALAEAIRELTPANGLTRPKATRAIVLFTDGSPNIDPSALPPNANFTQCVADCQTQATSAYNLNPSVPIFSIGLAMDPNMASNQQICLNSITLAANGGSSSGISTWQQITSASQVQTAFESIAKNLVVITK